MIRTLFFPDQIGDYYLFKQRFIGLDIGKTQVSATQVLFSGRAIIVEKTVVEKIAHQTGADHEERLKHALEKVAKSLDAYDKLVVAVSSSLVIFKELRLPFIGAERVSMTVGFEVEPLLPFALDDAIVDCIVTHEDRTKNSSDVLVAALQKRYVAELLALTESVGLAVTQMTVDLFAVYALYKAIPTYAALQGGVVLVDLGSHATQIAYIYNGQLRLVRSLAKGTVVIAKALSDALGVPLASAMELFMRYGLEPNDHGEYTQVITTVMTSFWREIVFTLHSFVAQTGAEQRVSRMILFGGGSTIKGLTSFIKTSLQVTAELFDGDLLSDEKIITLQHKHGVTCSTLVSLSAALLYPPITDFSLQRKEFAPVRTDELLTKQLVVGLCLSALFIGSLIVSSVISVNRLALERQQSETEVREQLHVQLKGLLADSGTQDLSDLVRQAEQAVRKEERLWFSFANPARASFLKYLLELTNKIDVQGIGFVVDKLQLTNEAIIVKASVRDHDALRILERELRQSKLFKLEKAVQDPKDFTMKLLITQTQ